MFCLVNVTFLSPIYKIKKRKKTADSSAVLIVCIIFLKFSISSVAPEYLIPKIQSKPDRSLFAVRQGSTLISVETEGRFVAIVEGDCTGIRAVHLIVKWTSFFIVCPEASAAILLKCKESHIVTRFKAHFTRCFVNNLVQNIILFCHQNLRIERSNLKARRVQNKVRTVFLRFLGIIGILGNLGPATVLGSNPIIEGKAVTLPLAECAAVEIELSVGAVIRVEIAATAGASHHAV